MLSKTFIEQYKNTPSPFDNYGLGEFVYRRTYSRIKDNGESEEWYETIQRVTEGLLKIKKRHFEDNNIFWDNKKETEFAENIYKLMFHVKFLPGGRNLWAMGTKITDNKHCYAALNNCAAVSTDNDAYHFSRPFTFLFDACMLGIGVGYNTFGAGKIIIQKPKLPNRTVIIEDSREGWVNGLKELLDSYFIPNQQQVIIDYSKIRPAGIPLSTFGGTSSGPEPFKRSMNMIEDILKKQIGKMITSRNIVDIMNIIALCVIAGNVRRSASIALGDPSDTEFIELKNYTKNPERVAYGWLSNNSVYAKIGMDYTTIANGMKINGEPGIVWLENARKYSRLQDPPDWKDNKASLLNPCAEITLESFELCNLTEIFINQHTDINDFCNTAKYAFEYGKIVSLCDTHWPETNEVIRRNRRVGVSLTGIVNFIEDHGIDNLRIWANQGYQTIINYDKEISAHWKVVESIKHTTVKPSGTISLLVPNTSPGVHFPTSHYYIRRVRVNNKATTLLESMKNKGYNIVPSETEPETVVIEFPIDMKTHRTTENVTIWEQFELASKLQEWWADNQVSCTITFDPQKEGDDIVHCLNHYQYKLKGISLLPKIECVFPQMPYEKITKEQYDEMLSKIDNNKRIQVTGNDQIEESFCTTDMCFLKSSRYNQKRLIFMRGLPGCGKSFIAKKLQEALTANNGKTVIVSHDMFRYTSDGNYDYSPETEELMLKNYNTALISAVVALKNKYVILDNTHIDKKQIVDVLELLKNKGINDITYCIVNIPPFNNHMLHCKNNIHNITESEIKRQVSDYWKNNQEISDNLVISIQHINESKFTNEQINNLVKQVMEYLN